MGASHAGQLWHEDAHTRLQTARNISPADQASYVNSVSANCPVPTWPHGMPTAINPKIVVLGPSPGNSPEKGEKQAPSSYSPPTFGTAHSKLFYSDARGFFAKVRLLCIGILREQYGLSDGDALALSGMMNLDIGQFGRSSEVKYDPNLVRWVLRTIIDKLRPDHLICIGLKSEAKVILPQIAQGIDATRPDRVLTFRAYAKRSLTYQEWSVKRNDSATTRVVLWPQHPGKAPFTNAQLWQASIDEYVNSLTSSSADG